MDCLGASPKTLVVPGAALGFAANGFAAPEAGVLKELRPEVVVAGAPKAFVVCGVEPKAPTLEDELGAPKVFAVCVLAPNTLSFVPELAAAANGVDEALANDANPPEAGAVVPAGVDDPKGEGRPMPVG